MKRIKWIYILMLLIICQQRLVSQSDPSNDLHQIQLLAGSRPYIKSFFEKYSGIEDQFIYTFLLPPMICSRCEGVINPIISHLKNFDSTSKIILMVFYPKEKAVQKYLQKRNYQADLILILKNNQFLENFQISSGEIQVPYLLKFNMLTGDLVYSKSTLGISLSKKVVKEIYLAVDPLERLNILASEKSIKERKLISMNLRNRLDELPVLKPNKKIIINESDDYPLSSVNFLNFDEHGKYFSFMDFLSYQVYFYEITDTQAILKSAIKPSVEEDRLFVSKDISDTLYLFLKVSNILNSMYFSSHINEDKIIIAASLPRLFFEDKEKENLSYYNQTTYIEKCIDNLNFSKYIVPEKLPDTNIFTPDHTQTIFINDKMFLPVSKGWPGTGTEMLSDDDIEKNPFADTFYDFTPLIAVYYNDGCFIKYLGSLAESFKKARVGYQYTYLKADVYGQYFWLSDGYAGNVSYFDSITYTLKDRVNIFSVNDSICPYDYHSEPLKYILDYQNIYNKVILDFKVLKNCIYCFIKEGEHHKCIVKTLRGELLKEDYLPDELNEMKFVTGKLIRKKDKIFLMSVYETPEQSAIFEFSL